MENQLEKLSGRWGDDIVVGNALFTAPDKMAISSISVRVDGTVIQALKQDATKTAVLANVESTFKSPAVVLNNGEWHPFVNNITAIQLTNSADSVTVWYKPLV